MTHTTEHVPVLLNEVLDEVQPIAGKKVIDATLGFGGHTRALLEKGAQVLAFEYDPEVLAITKKRLKNHCPDASYDLSKTNFAQIADVAKKKGYAPADVVLFDLGISQWHYHQANRGFSFSDKSLDMRLNPKQQQTALDIVNNYTQQELNELFTKLVQEKFAGQIAQALVRARNVKPIEDSQSLAEIVKEVYEREKEETRTHPATKVFLALRIIVNQEIENLKNGLEGAWKIIKPGGKLLVITFQSTEARAVKLFTKKKGAEISADKVILPKQEEIKQNPSSRSSQLRVYTKKE